MKVHKELFDRWSKYVSLLLADNKLAPADIVKPVDAWNIAYKLHIPLEAYRYDLNDRHIETALRKIFPNAWTKPA